MAISARVVFDLFGTLVPQFPRAEHDQALDDCSRIAGLDAERCRIAWRELYAERVQGNVRGIRGHLQRVADGQRVVLDAERREAACDEYRRFVPQMLVPIDDTCDVLESLRIAGAQIGLLSNAHDDVVDAFETTELASYFDVTIFSCRIGYQKPDPMAFAAVLDAMGRSTQDVITFVGDGSDDELSGAARAGMHPVLLRADLTNAYDGARPDVETWTGDAIDRLSELPQLLLHRTGKRSS